MSLWYEEPQRGSSLTLFRDLAFLLGLWHEARRGSHNGVHDFWCGSTRILLANTLHGPRAERSPYADLAPATNRVFRTSAALRKAVQKAFKPFPGRSQSSICRDLSRPMREVDACRGRGRGC